jgi:ABC-2 type transport system ATP-binding protein
MSNAISVDRISKSYGDFVAVNELSIEVKTGSIFGLLGPNGAGKSTTIRMIVNITMPDSGQITLFGRPMSAKLQERVGYLPEDRGLYKKMKIGEQLAFFAELKGLPRQEAYRRIDAWLKRIEMTDWKNKKWEELSKGMQQKVQFVSTILHSPDLVILDEPFSGLDPVNAQVLKEAVLEMRRRGTTVVFSTHDMSTAEKMCDRIFMIFRGRKVLDGSLESIQGQYGADTVRVRTSAGVAALAGMPDVDSVNDFGQMQEVRLKGDPQVFLVRLTERAAVYQFEVTRPSLEDIFVRIARPDARA